MPAWLPGAGSVGVPLLCVVWLVQLFVFGSILSLLIDIEENTRALAGRSNDLTENRSIVGPIGSEIIATIKATVGARHFSLNLSQRTCGLP